MKRKVIVFISSTILVFACTATLPSIFLPKRWLEIKPGLERSTVHTILGIPDADYSIKAFDGWHNSFGPGASVLTVHYDETLSKVKTTKIETRWGFEHRNWVQEYKLRLAPNPIVDKEDTRRGGH